VDHHTSHLTRMFYFLAGSVIGASVALLLAQKSGKVTREIMGQKLRDTADS
jgi:gas vesicle protein